MTDAASIEKELFAALEPWRKRAEQALLRYADSWHGPDILREAMSYAVHGGGKRLRPALVYATLEALGAPLQRGDAAGVALEWIHAYSLAHDDLPALDDDDERRGRPSLHRAYDEALALLVGDALQAEAFRVVAEDDGSGRSDTQRARCAVVLALAAGAGGMVGGQVLDIRGIANDVETMQQMHAMKTGALFVGACKLGAICADATEAQVEALAQYGHYVGLAFQLSDDLLDLDEVVESAHEQEVNLAALLGVEAAVVQVRADVDAALAALERAEAKGRGLRLLAEWTLARAEAVQRDG